MRSMRKVILLLFAATFLSVACEYPYPFTWLTPGDNLEEKGSTKPSVVETIEENVSEPVNPSAVPVVNGTTEPAQPAGFLPSDCSACGMTFDNITAEFNTSDPFDGPFLICNSTTTGGNGLNEIHQLDVHAVKPEFLTSSFAEQKSVWKPIIDDAIAWKEKNPTASTEVIMIRDDEGGYIYLVLTNANVQGCLLGEGYGSEIFNSYLVNMQFSSCEGNAAEYLQAIEKLRDTARKAVERVREN